MEQKDYNRPLLRVGIQVAVVTLLVAIATWYIERNPEQLRTIFRAGTTEKEVKVSLYPKEITPEPGSEFTLTPMIVSTNKKPGFISITITYDPSILRLSTIDESKREAQLETILPIDITQSNQTGIVELTYGATNPENLPGNAIQLTSLSFTYLQSAPTNVTIDPSKSQIVFMDEQEAEILPENASIRSVDTQLFGTPDPTISQATQVTPMIEPTSIMQTNPTIEPTAAPEKIIPSTTP